MRLTLWYSGILGVTFVLLCGALFYEFRAGLYNEIDQELLARFDSLALFLKGTKSVRWAEELDEEADVFSGSLSTGQLLQIREQRGAYLYQSPSIRRLRIPVPEAKESRGFARAAAAGRAFRVMTRPITIDGHDYFILLAADTRQADAAVERFAWLLLAALPLALGLASAGGYWMSRRALRPVGMITESARSIGASNLSKRVEVPATADELQRLSETLNEMISRLEASFKGMAQFTADASHELRTPVTLIRTAAELSLRQPQTENAYREALQLILEESERTTSLIEKLMILARNDAGSEVFLCDPVDLCSIVRGVVRQGKTLAQAKALTMSSELPPSPVAIMGDAPKLHQLFLTFVDNAVKYTPPGGTVKVRLGVQEGWARVVVQDSGIGIPREDLPSIFERFYRADKARSRELDGFGLGLAIAKTIADAHHAKIHVESTPEHGSVFTVSLALSGE
jgi:heavy metal sensor kinase